MKPDQPEILTLVLATRNRHKVAEIQAILGSDVICRSLDDFSGVPTLREDADSFSGNASAKAHQLAVWLSQRAPKDCFLVLADDSGLEVDALHGAPGVRSARFAADEAGRWLANRGQRLKQVQIFMPLAGTVASAMYYARIDGEGRPLYIAGARERNRQKKLLTGKILPRGSSESGKTRKHSRKKRRP